MKRLLIVLFALLVFYGESFATVWQQNVPIDTPKLVFTGQVTSTIASGVITAIKSHQKVRVEAGASDDLITINGGRVGQVLVLEADDPTKPIYLLRTGNIQGDADVALTYSAVILIYNGTKWVLPKASSPTPAAITVADTASATGYFSFFEAATGDIGPKTDAGARYDATTGSPTFSGTVTAGAFAVPKVDGVAGDTGWYEANSTGTSSGGFRGPLSLTYSYRGQLPNARATGARQALTISNTGESGTGTDNDPYVQAISFSDIEDRITATFDGGGAEIADNKKAVMTVPFNCIITGGQLLASKALGTSGTVSIVIDIWREATPADYDGGSAHPAVTDSICTGGTKPTVSADNAAAVVLTSWASVTLTKGDILVFNVDSATDTVIATLILYVKKS